MADGKPGTAQPTDLSDQATGRDRVEKLVLDVLFSDTTPLTRVDLAARTGLSKPTVNSAVRRLENEGLLTPAGLQTGRQGRIATYYEIAPTAGSVLAVELNPAVIRVAVSDLAGNTLQHSSVSTRKNPAEFRAHHESIIIEAAEGVRRTGTPLRTLAVSVAKPVNPQTFDVFELPDAPYPDPEGVTQLAHAISDRIDVPLLIDNDVNLAAIGEQHSGIAKDVRTFAYIYVGAGIGGGIVVDGELMRGSRGLAGEIGYLPSRADTTGGLHGLAHAMGSLGLGPRRDDAWYVDTITEAQHLLASAESGDQAALAVVERAGKALGEAAMAITAVLDPDMLVLGGPIGIHPLLVAGVQQTLDSLTITPIKVVASALGATAPIEGAMELARRFARAQL